MIAVSSKKTKLNVLDLLLIITVLFSISGFILAKAEKTGLNKVIEGQENIAIEVLLPDVYLQEITDLFKIGEKSAITIRNRPYTKLNIIKTDSRPKQLVIPSLSGSYKTINDPTRTNVKDYFVTLNDSALKTNDDYVIGGNKIKIGNQVELEGFNYRLNGKVINVYPLPLNE